MNIAVQALMGMKSRGEVTEEEFLRMMLKNGQIGIDFVYKDTKIPLKATEKSSCYDVFSYLKTGTVVTVYNGYNEKQKIQLTEDRITILPFCRYLIPTGCKFWIPAEHSLRIHPRSGGPLKQGLSIPNCEGIIDEDYPEQTYAIIANWSFMTATIEHHERVCQIELVSVLDFGFFETKVELVPFTDRVSGLGHTGSK